MKISRNITNYINWGLDNLLPPIIRDNPIFMGPFFKLMFGKKAKYFIEFKERSPFMTREEYNRYYALLEDVHIKRETDLNKPCIEEILKRVEGNTILDIGAGRGYLAKLIAKKRGKKVTGVDIYIPDYLKDLKNPTFIESNVEKLPFKNKSFDTVIATHTIEHVLEPEKVVKEMRRVAKKKIIIVVPRQRENRYTFDLHLNFFPYLYDLLRVTKNPKGKAKVLQNDIYYEEPQE
jgi:ubiquinone/menaquinone biosynthesis C-methylase UbiE